MITCQLCGIHREADGVRALAWVHDREPDGRERWLCPDCARRHARDIEAKLPLDWW
jgi:hypothetical protein